MNKNEGQGEFQWQSQTQHLMFFIAYLMDWSLFNFVVYETPSLNSEYEPSLVHFLVLIILTGGPMLFFQTFVGEYSGRGCIFLGEMIPAAYGLGFAMLLISFARFTNDLFFTTKILAYLFSIMFNRTLPWMNCKNIYSDMFKNCFGKEDLDLCPTRARSNKTCFAPYSRVLSTFIYKEHGVFMRFKELSVSQKNLKLIYHSFQVSILLPLLLIFALKGIRSFAVSLRGCMIFCLGASFSIFMALVTRPGAGHWLSSMFHQINSKSLLNLSTWSATLRRVIEGLRLAEGGQFLFGSFISESGHDFRRTIYLAAIFFIMIFATMLYYYLAMELINFKLNMSPKQLRLRKEEATIFETFPLILGIQASSYLFSLLYFIVLFLLSFHALILKVLVIEKTIAVQFDITGYSFFVKSVLIVLATALTYAMEMVVSSKAVDFVFEGSMSEARALRTCLANEDSSAEACEKSVFRQTYYEEIRMIGDEIKRFQSCVLALQILSLLLYGLQRISDDVYFFTNSQINSFIKLCWIVTLVFCALNAYEEFKSTYKVNSTVRMVVGGALCSPLVILFILKLFSHIRKQNIIGLLRPSDLYGPPDPEMRIFRILYNPRLAIKCKQREETCYHSCLLKSKALEIAVQEEINLIKKLKTDLETNASEALQTHVISALNSYEKTLLKGLSKKNSEGKMIPNDALKPSES